MAFIRAFTLVLACGLAASASADPMVVRLASVAPEGTAWAHLLKGVADDVDVATHGAVRVKWYFGGIAGDDLQMGERIARGQLDGTASAGLLCSKLAPSMRALRLMGVYQSGAEAAYVMGRLKPTLDEEFTHSGFTNLMEVALGSDVIFSRQPIRRLADLKRQPHWIWSLDEVMNLQLPAIGFDVVPLPLDGAGRAYEDKRIDGFIALPTAALAFQWSAQARYVSDLNIGFLSGCLIVSNRAFDALPIEAQRAFRSAAAKLQRRMEQMGREQDQAILNGMFARQGLQRVPADASFRNEVFEAARVAREKLGEKLVPPRLLERVLALLTEYRARPHTDGAP